MQASRCWSMRPYCENANCKPVARTADAQTILGRRIGSSQKGKVQDASAYCCHKHCLTANADLASYRGAGCSAAAGVFVVKQVLR